MTADHNKRRREQEGTLDDRLTSLHDDLLISILSFLSSKQRVALSAVCSRFRLLLPSIPRLDAFRLDVRLPSGGVDVHKELTFPRAQIRQCHLVFRDVADDLPKPLEQLLVDDLVEAGVQDLTLQNTGNGWLYLSGSENCGGFFGIKSLRSLCLENIRVSKYSDRRPFSPRGCTFLTSLKMKFSVLGDDFLGNLLASCPFLETLQLIRCYMLEAGMNKLSFHSASIKHLFMFQNHMRPSITIDVRAPQLELLIVPVATTLRIEAPQGPERVVPSLPKAAGRSSRCIDEAFRRFFSKASRFALAEFWQRILAAGNGIDRVNSIFKLDFNLKDQLSTTILTELLKKCNCNTKFDINIDPTRMESSTETAKEDEHLLHGSTGLELINLQMMVLKMIFEGFLSDQKKMKKFKDRGLESWFAGTVAERPERAFRNGNASRRFKVPA